MVRTNDATKIMIVVLISSSLLKTNLTEEWRLPIEDAGSVTWR